MSANFAAFLYLVSGVLFILALRGLSHPTTSRQGNIFGMIGMGIAIVTTLALATPSCGGFVLIVARPCDRRRRSAPISRARIPMTAMPQLVAAFHSLVGLAAVLVAAAALYAPAASASARSARSTARRWSRCASASPSAPSPSPARSSPS